MKYCKMKKLELYSSLTKISVPTYKQRLKQKGAKVDNHQMYGLVLIRICLVSHSYFGDLKMADPVNVWDFPIKFFSL